MRLPLLAVLVFLLPPAAALPAPAGAWVGHGIVTWNEGTVERACFAAAPVPVSVAFALVQGPGVWGVAMQYAAPLPTCVSSTYACDTAEDPFAGYARLICQGVVIWGYLFLEAEPGGGIGVHWVFGEDAARLDADLPALA